ncbi:MAG TPA: response regulator [Salinarimonas sp.]|jgi:DNA-binding response OmpR family regulator|nr:response regulator [Salinarimonas sp.]
MRVMILEDDPLIALDLCLIVEEAGHEVAAVCASRREGLAAIERGIDFALLDIDVLDGKSFPLAEALRARAIPFAFVSASLRGELPPSLAGAPFIAKPFAVPAIVGALTP